MDRDPHQVLGISSRATLDEAEDAYHRLLRREHPDLHHNDGPERVARAERRTRELNAAISALRDADPVRAGARVRADEGPTPGAGGSGRAGTTGAGTTGAGTTGAHDGAHAAEDGGGIWGEDEGGWTVPPDPTPTAAFPWCGETFVHAVDLKDHVFDRHDLRIDRRVRGGLFGGRVTRGVRAAAHVPLWGLIPLNLALALFVGVLAAIPANESVGRWVFMIVLTPSVAAIVDRLFDLSR